MSRKGVSVFVALSTELTRVMPNLRAVGVLVDRGRSRGKRLIRITSQRLLDTDPTGPTDPRDEAVGVEGAEVVAPLQTLPSRFDPRQNVENDYPASAWDIDEQEETA